ncbi:MAG: VCBS repeat-containing protein [Sphingobacteriaceae bacterium]|nr:VCBS repeat-containing protein [Sphingobacteriaceae bacterium]
MKKTFTILITALILAVGTIANAQVCNAPVINTFSPNTGFIGSTVTISGSYFDPIPANNQVFFGATKAQVLTASFGVLTVKVPLGATYAPITVKNGCNLIGASSSSFNGIFCPTTISATTYNTVSYSQYVSGGYQMVSQDMDLDGKPDLLVTGFTQNSISIVRNLSNPGAFSFAPEYRVYLPGPSRCQVPADFDGDGKIDIAVTVTGYGTYLLKNNSTPGNISFTQVGLLAGTNGYQIAAGDLNNDGKIDLANTQGNILFTFRNTSTPGTISFIQNTNINNIGSATGIAIADVDGNGTVDIGTSCGGNNFVTAVRNTTAPGATTFTFAPTQTWATGSAYPYRLFLGDFDKDGKIDFTTNNHNGGTTSIFRNTSAVGTISFAAPYNMASPSSNYRIGVGDADGDGSPDIVTKSSGENKFSVYKNTSTGAGNISFAPRIDYAGQAEVSGVLIADLDGDNVPDISTSGISYNSLRVHRNNSTVTDNTPPVAIAKNIIVPLSPAGTAIITPAMIDNGSSDACGLDSITLNKSAFTCADLGANAVILRVRDRAGNISTAPATVTVVSAAIIVAGQSTVCQGQTVAMSANTGDSYQWFRNGVAIDGATSQSYSASESGEYTVAVTNAGGCSGTSSATTVNVNNNPTVTTLPTGNASLCNGQLTITASESSTYQWYKNGVLMAGATQRQLVTTTAGTYTVSVLDLFGCSAISAPVAVNATDNVAPVAKAKNITLALDSSGVASITTSSIDNGSADNCSAVTLSITGPTTFNCSDVGAPVSVTLVVSDASGNQSSAVAEVTVTDPGSFCNAAPVAIAKSLVLPANANCQAIASALDFNNGSTDADGDSLTYSVSPAGPYKIGVTNVTLTVTDTKGASSTSAATITVNDVTPPSITAPASFTVNNNLNKCSAVVNYAMPVATDNCSVVTSANVVHVLQSGQQFYDFANNRFESQSSPGLPLTFNPTDGQKMAVFLQSGSSTHYLYQNVTLPAVGPIVLSYDLKYTNHYGSFDSNNQFIAVQIRNASTNALLRTVFKTNPGAPSSIPMTSYSFDISEFAGQNVRLQVIDATVNNFYLDVLLDNVKITGSSLVNGSFESDYLGWTASSSNSSFGVWGIGYGPGTTIAQTVGLPSGAIFPVGTTTNTFVATDAAGNTSTQSFDVTVKDTQLPNVLTQNIIVQLNAAGTAGIVVSQINNNSTDNCGIASYSLNKSSFDCSNVGANIVELTVTDIHGNVASAQATVTVQDNIAPIVATQNVTVQLDANGQGAITESQINNGSSDNCSIASYSLDKKSFDCSNVGVNTVTLTVTDVNGNSSSATATVTVEDNVAPIALTQNISVTLVNGSATITAASVDNNSNDACGIQSLSIDKSAFDCSNLGNNTVILTVTDKNGNVSSASAVVNVIGVTPVPTVAVTRTDNTFTGLNNKTIALGYGAQSLTLNATNGTSSNSLTTYAWSPSTGLSSATSASPVFTPSAAGSYTFDVIATNEFGCSAATSVTITVVDVRCGNKNDKVLVCQKTGSAKNPWVQICISPNAVNAHLVKGSTIGNCGSTGSIAAVSSLDMSLAPGLSVNNTNSLAAYPNPLAKQTTVTFNVVTDEAKVTLDMFNVSGAKVQSIYSGPAKSFQEYSFSYDASAIAPGVYFFKLTGSNVSLTFKAIVTQ